MQLVVFLCLMLGVSCIYAEPWYAGPLLSDPAVVTPVGHGFVQWHIYKVYNDGFYNADYQFNSLPLATTGEIDSTFNYGITNDTEVQLLATYLNNRMEQRQKGNLGDTTITVSKQLLLQQGKNWPPNVKVMYRQVFPTGHYDALNPELFATDATGQGSYLTSLAFNMEHVAHLFNEKYLVGFATVTLTYANRVRLRGYSIYGGGSETDGTIWPGNNISFNLAMEYVPNRHWGYIIETFIHAQKASVFKGYLGPVETRFTQANQPVSRIRTRRLERVVSRIVFNRLRPSILNFGSLEGIGHGNVAQFTLAPAIDYSFSKNVALTAGLWFVVAGKNTPVFYTPMLSFTAGW